MREQILDIALWLELDARAIWDLEAENDHHVPSHIKGYTLGEFTIRAKAHGAGHRWSS